MPTRPVCLALSLCSDNPSKPSPSSSALAAETNTNANGVVLKYNEPPEARKPTHNWRLYVFKGKEQVGESHAVTRGRWCPSLSTC